MSRQFSQKDIWRLQKDTWKLNDIMGLVKRKILQLLIMKLIQPFLSWKKVFAHPPACHTLFAAILSQQEVEEVIKNKYNNHKNTIFYANILIEVNWFKFLSNYKTHINNWNTFPYKAKRQKHAVLLCCHMQA